MDVVWPDDVTAELNSLPLAERVAMGHAISKLEVATTQLGFPHSSAVQGSSGLRELRPRSGRSPWRAFYRRVGDLLVIGAIGPEAAVDHRRFQAAVDRAEERIGTYQKGKANGQAKA